VDHGTSQRSELIVCHVDGSTSSLFVKNTPIRLGARLLDAWAGLCEREARFYRDVAAEIPSAPKSLISEWDPRTRRSTIVLPNLVEDGFEFRPNNDPCTPAQIELALEALADLHTWGGPRADGTLGDAFDLGTKSQRRMSRFVCRVLGRGPKALRDIVPENVLADSRLLATRAKEYAIALDSFPQAFIHNDTHRGNIGFSPSAAALIDWQVCGWGPALKDVAYLMATSLEPEDRRATEHDLLDHYLTAVEKAGGERMDHEEAWFAYRVLTVTGYVAAAFAAMFRDRLQAAANAEAGLRRASAAVDDLNSFAALREHLDNTRRS
jgi:hypothetical protein